MFTTTAPAHRPTPESFGRIVTNVAGYPVGTDTSFGMAAAHVAVWVPRPNTWVISVIEISEDLESITWVRTIGICPGQFRELEAVFTAEGSPVVAGEFHSAEAAVGSALDWVTAPAYARHAQNAHDPVAV